jgi:hypothetical protein
MSHSQQGDVTHATNPNFRIDAECVGSAFGVVAGIVSGIDIAAAGDASIT